MPLKKTSLLMLVAVLAFLHTTAQTNFVFYLHGAIVEGTTSDPISESFGRYEYSSIIRTLKQHGFVVISEVREANTMPDVYALKVAGQVDSLKKAGVKPERITVIGASKGAVIAMLVSGLVKDKDVKYVILAGCSQSAGRYPLDLYGQILSIYEHSDNVAGSCLQVKRASHGVKKFHEVELHTGKQHGFIYRPIQEWIDPVVAWITK